MGWENYDERIRNDDRITLDAPVDMRRKLASRLRAHSHDGSRYR